MHLRALLFALVALASFARGEDYEARVFTAPDGAKLPYRLLKPAKLDPAQKYPLVVFLQCRNDEFPDMLHPNAVGYAKWTAELKPILDRLPR